MRDANSLTEAMSEFVNYNKRDVTLPPGCKDLIDLLQKGGVTWPIKSIATTSVHPTAQLRKFRYIIRLVFCRFIPCTLVISTIDKRLSLVLCREREQEVSALALVRSARREQGIREFLQRQGIALLHDHLMPAEAGVKPVRSLKFSLAPLKASRITTELLRTACNCTDDSMIRFQYHFG